MKRNLVKLITILVIIIITITLSSCESTDKTIHGAYGEDFEMYLQDTESNLTDDIVKCSVKVVLEKKNDITDKSNYDYQGFHQYSYSVNINGTLDSKYAGKEIILYIVFIPEYHLARCGNNGAKGVVSENGIFSYSYTFDSNAFLTEWVPYNICLFDSDFLLS